MCTLSIFLDNNTLLLTANRDELRSRGESGIKKVSKNEYQQIYPTDTLTGGTWIGMNNHGIVAALLNMYEVKYQGSKSRGLIIPEVLKHQSLTDTHSYLTKSFQSNLYSCFVLIVADSSTVHRYSWDGKKLLRETLATSEDSPTWLLETSSSVETQNTIEYRKRLFQNWQKSGGNSCNILDFHLQQNPSNPSSSVCMSRELSHTKSITQILLAPPVSEISYLKPKALGAAINTSLPNLRGHQTKKLLCSN